MCFCDIFDNYFGYICETNSDSSEVDFDGNIVIFCSVYVQYNYSLVLYQSGNINFRFY